MLTLQAHRIRQQARDVYNTLRRATPSARRTEAAVMARRATAQPLLDVLSRRPELGPEEETRFRNVLVDGMWDNPNYWTRFAMIRAALGLWQGRETGPNEGP